MALFNIYPSRARYYLQYIVHQGKRISKSFIPQIADVPVTNDDNDELKPVFYDPDDGFLKTKSLSNQILVDRSQFDTQINPKQISIDKNTIYHLAVNGQLYPTCDINLSRSISAAYDDVSHTVILNIGAPSQSVELNWNFNGSPIPSSCWRDTDPLTIVGPDSDGNYYPFKVSITFIGRPNPDSSPITDALMISYIEMTDPRSR